MLNFLYSLSLLIITSFSLSDERIDVGFNNASSAHIQFSLDIPQEDKPEFETKAKPALFYLSLQVFPQASSQVISTVAHLKSPNYILSFKHQRAPPFIA